MESGPVVQAKPAAGGTKACKARRQNELLVKHDEYGVISEFMQDRRWVQEAVSQRGRMNELLAPILS